MFPQRWMNEGNPDYLDLDGARWARAVSRAVPLQYREITDRLVRPWRSERNSGRVTRGHCRRFVPQTLRRTAVRGLTPSDGLSNEHQRLSNPIVPRRARRPVHSAAGLFHTNGLLVPHRCRHWRAAQQAKGYATVPQLIGYEWVPCTTALRLPPQGF